MRALLASAVMGGVGTFLAFAGVRSVVSERTRHLKQNYRGVTLIATAGMVLLFPVGLGFAQATTIVPWNQRFDGLITALATATMAILGLVDDLYGSRHAGGLVGHTRELLRGRVTTGLVKMLGGAAIGVLAAFAFGHRGIWILVAGATIAMSANMANLLDLRPARTAKVFVPLAIAACTAIGPTGPARVLAAVVGGAVVFAYWELREVVMLGDVGANLLGTVLGAAMVASLSRSSIALVAGVLLALTLVAEKVSFSRVIDAVPPLRWLDMLGRVSGDP